jgi:hypothetical protein
MRYSSPEDEICKKMTVQFPSFNVDPKSEDPTIQAGVNAYAILAMREPADKNFDGVPYEASKQKDRIKDFARREQGVCPPSLRQAWGSFISDVGYACEKLNSPSKAEQHLNELLEIRTRSLVGYFASFKRTANESGFVDEVRTRASRVGIAADDIDKAVNEVVKGNTHGGRQEPSQDPCSIPPRYNGNSWGNLRVLLALSSIIIAMLALGAAVKLKDVVLKGNGNTVNVKKDPTHIVIDDVELLYVRPYSLVFSIDSRVESDSSTNVDVSYAVDGQWHRATIVSSSPLGKSDSESVRFMCRLDWPAMPRVGFPIQFRVVASDGRESAVFEKSMVRETTVEFP